MMPSTRPDGSSTFLGRLFGPRAPEPFYPKLPHVDERRRASVRGVYVVGEVASTPLGKLGLNRGVALADQLKAELALEPAVPGALDVVVIGAGSAGLGFAIRAKELGLSFVVLEAGRIATTSSSAARRRRRAGRSRSRRRP
ncbi:MAG: FAD-binding protein [Deltaproteobacteria bacterium]|nr:FAD-binding protein [Deltaproteobacteria bacterium]